MIPITDSSTPNLNNSSESRQASSQSDFMLDTKLKQEAGQIITTNQQQNITTGVLINKEHWFTKKLVESDVTTEHFAASVNKVPVSVLLLEKLRTKQITLDTQLTWVASDVRGGAGDFDQPGAPLNGTVREVLKDLLNKSGNTAVRIIVNKVLGGADAVNTAWKQRYNLQHTYLQPLEGDPSKFYLGYTNSTESLKMLKKIVESHDYYGRVMQDYMATNIWDAMGVRSVLGDQKDIKLINKIGFLNDPEGNNRHDIGFIINTKTGKTLSYAFLETSPDAVTPQADQSLKDLGAALIRRVGGTPQTTATQPNMRTFDSSARQQQAVDNGRILY